MRIRVSISEVMLALIMSACISPESTAQTAWQPAKGHAQILLWPNGAPNPRAGVAAESAGVVVRDGKPKLVGGKPWTYVANVTKPTFTVYSPDGKNTGAAVIVFPGGGYNVLAMDLEGTEACDWLTANGITCVLLKYRVPCAHVGPFHDCPSAHQDAQRVMRMVRSRAAEWKINPNKIGVLGFSAGGHMVIESSTNFDKLLYPAVDAADKVSSRPDFAIALYPGHVIPGRNDLRQNPDIHVVPRTPPTFLVHAYDDPTDPVENSLFYFDWLRKAKIPSEMHVYATGGHAFGLRGTNAAITAWPDVALAWLKSIGII